MSTSLPTPTARRRRRRGHWRPPQARRSTAERLRSARGPVRMLLRRRALPYVVVLLVLAAAPAGILEDACRLIWIAVGALVLVADGVLRLDTCRRRSAHDACGLRDVAGWRLLQGDANPDLLLALDLLIYLTEHVDITRRPIRGRRHRARVTYAVPLRELGREWGRSRGVSGRRADRLLADDLCERFGVIRRVPVGTTSAFHLTDASTSSAIAHLETASGVRLVAWQLGRDPAWDSRGSACGEAARA